MRERSVVLLAILAILGSMLAYTAARPGSVLAAPGVADPATSTIDTDVPAMTVDDDATITVTLIDEFGDPLTTGGDTVTLATTVGSISVVADIGDGTYTATITSEDPGSATITGTVNTADIVDNATVAITPGAADPANTTIEAAPPTINVDVGESAITVTAIDQYGNQRDAGGDEVVLATLPGTLSAVTDNDDGTYSATLTDTITHTDTVSGKINTFDIVDNATVDFTPGALHHFVFDTIVGQTAGNAFTVTVTAYDQYNNIKTDYDGGATLSGAPSPGCSGCTPALPSVPAAPGELSPWVDGVATATGVIAYDADTAAQLTVADGAIDDVSGTFAVTHAVALAGFDIAALSSETAGTSTSVSVTAYDAYGNVKADYSNVAATLSGLGASPGCGGCNPVLPQATATHGSLSWAGGIGSGSVTARDADGAAALTVTDAGAAISDTETFEVIHAATLAGFTVDTTIGTQIAGTAFTVVVTAYDAYGNVKTNHGTGGLSGLIASPGCPALSCSPAIAPASPNHGTFGWVAGVGTNTTVTAVNSQALETLTMSDTGITDTSNTFTVNPATETKLLFADAAVAIAFNGQPLDTKVSQPIDSVCGPYVPPVAPAPANPCAPATSVPTKVLAIDAYGNRVAGVNVIITGAHPQPSGTAVLPGTLVQRTAITVAGTPGVAPYGEASFSAINFGTVNATTSNTYKLRAQRGGTSLPVDSGEFDIVRDLEACDGTLCDNLAVNGSSNAQIRTFDKITTGNDFFVAGTTNVILTTQFLPVGAIDGKCGQTTIGTPTDVQVAGAGTVATAPTSSMLIVIPKNTLKFYNVTSRGTPSFNACLGALLLDPAHPNVPWKAKSPSGALVNASLSDGRYWGVPADCGATGLRPTDPCIALRTKQRADVAAALGLPAPQVATFMNDADLAILVRKPFPWDGKGGAH